MLVHGFNRRFAAQSAARRCKNMPRELLKVHVHCRRKKNVQRVLVIRRFATSAMRDFDDIAPLSNQSFRQQKPGGKFIITPQDRKSTRLNSSHGYISYAVFCL